MSSEIVHDGGPNHQKALEFFKRGNDAANKENYDYAIQMYRDACKLEPDNLKFRQSLRVTEWRKYGDPSKVGRLVGARTQPIRMRARSARSKGHPAQALEICEEAFALNPWDTGAARDAAEAAEQLGYKALAQWLLESVSMHAKDAEFHRYAAHIHELNASWQKAIASWERVKKINPNDQDALHQINAISASATIHRSGLSEALKKRPEGGSGPESSLAAELEELKQPQRTPEDRLRKEIEENPEHVGPYLHLADHLRHRGQLDEAEKLLARAVKVVPDDPSLQMAYAEVQIARLQRAIATWSQRCREKPDDPVAKAKLEQIETMYADYELKEYRRRIKLHPEDARLHYELGVRLAKAGEHKDAIAAFQVARSSPTYKVQALIQAGVSFEAEGALKLAERSFQDALKAADETDLTVMNAIHYRLGRVSEAMGNTQMAEEHYNEVAANDYGYLDVAQRLRGLA
jgi:tetratricopeptide (TPR) repeat protein